MTPPGSRRPHWIATSVRSPAANSVPHAQRAQRPEHPRRNPVWRWALWVIRIATAAGLAIDAYVHFDLAGLYAEGGGAINEGLLFRAEAVVALLAAGAVLATGRRASYAAALLVSASALTVLLVVRYVDLGPLGPFPDLYDPAWFPEKVLAAFAEGAATARALAGVILAGMAGGPRPGGGPR